MDHRFDEYEPPVAGARFDRDTTAIEYMGEVEFHYLTPTEDDDYEFFFIHDGVQYLLSDFETTHSRRGHFIRWFDGISFDTVNSGMLIKLTSDGEGAFLFRHWGL